jgi:hypothetical protein
MYRSSSLVSLLGDIDLLVDIVDTDEKEDMDLERLREVSISS